MLLRGLVLWREEGMGGRIGGGGMGEVGSSGSNSADVVIDVLVFSSAEVRVVQHHV